MVYNKNPLIINVSEGDSHWFLGTLTTMKATADQTGGTFGLADQLLPPGWSSPHHVHRREDESFFVHEGEITVRIQEKETIATPGSFVYLPKEIPHKFWVSGTGPVRMTVLVVPGGFEQFFVEMGTPAEALILPPEGSVDIDKLLSLSKKYELDILPE